MQSNRGARRAYASLAQQPIGGRRRDEPGPALYYVSVALYFLLGLYNVALWIVFIVEPGVGRDYDGWDINALTFWILALIGWAIALGGWVVYLFALYTFRPTKPEYDNAPAEAPDASYGPNRLYNFSIGWSVNFFVHLLYFIVFIAIWVPEKQVKPIDSTPGNFTTQVLVLGLTYLLGITLNVAVCAQGISALFWAYDPTKNRIVMSAANRRMRLDPVGQRSNN
jgi:heme A synthase